MKTPDLLLGAALLFWGWQTGLLPFAIVLALVLEGARLVPWRWDLSRADFNRVSDLCTVVLLAMAVYLFSVARSAPRTSEAWRGITVIFEWLPLAFAPLLAAQSYSTADRVEISSFFWSLRKRAATQGPALLPSIDLTFPYFALCLLSASRANVRTVWFYVGLCGLSAWALGFTRSKRFSLLLCGGLFLAAALLGYGGQIALYRLQTALEATVLDWFFDLIQTDRDPYRTSTWLGSIGNLKLSDRIVLRVRPEAGARPPILLRDASYNLYNSPTWVATDSAFEAVQPEPDGATWKLEAGPAANRRVTISAYLKRGKGMLALPSGAFEIDRLTVVGLSRNRLGAVKVEEGPGLISYSVIAGSAASSDGPPSEIDLRLPAREAPVLARVAAELGLASRPPSGILEAVAAFFRDDFRYSTYLGERQLGSTPVGDFLKTSRAGHCEYFATATVLLLRAAGLPARYATGYSVREWSRLEQAYVVRARHAHSWALVYVDGAWRDFDTTPPAWADVEQANASRWSPVSDLWSWGAFLFSQWRWSEGGGLMRYVGWLLLPLIATLAWRSYGRKRLARAGTSEARAAAARPRPGGDSEFYAIERALGDLGLERHAWEPLAPWIDRITATGLVSADSLPEIVSLHCRYRFDPQGISAGEREALRSRAQSWLEHHRAASRGAPGATAAPGGHP